MTRSVIHTGYFDAAENHHRKAESRSFKKYIEDIRLQEALDMQDDSNESDTVSDENLC